MMESDFIRLHENTVGTIYYYNKTDSKFYFTDKNVVAPTVFDIDSTDNKALAEILRKRLNGILGDNSSKATYTCIYDIG